MCKAIAFRKQSSASRAMDWLLLGFCSRDGSGVCMWHSWNALKSSVGSVHLSVPAFISKIGSHAACVPPGLLAHTWIVQEVLTARSEES